MMLKWVLSTFLIVCASMGFATEGVSETAKGLFGEAKGESIKTGVIFVDGLYIKAPYTVAREGNVILINGRVASRISITSATTPTQDPAKTAADKAAAKHDPAGGSAGSENYVADKDGATLGGDEMPSLTNSSSAKAPAVTETPKGSAIEARLAAKAKSKAVNDKAKTGKFNSDAGSTDPTALFEESDYTYTPPKKAEPKAIPYVRPAAQKSMSERMADAKNKDREQIEKQVAVAPDSEADDSVVSEDFDHLTQDEIDSYTKKIEGVRLTIEKYLKADGMLFLSSTTASRRPFKRSSMQNFISQLPTWTKGVNANLLIARNPSMPKAYLTQIFDNREINNNDMKVLFARIKREKAEAAKKASR